MAIESITTDNVKQKIEVETTLFEAPSHQRATALLEAVRTESLHPHSAIHAYHPNLAEITSPNQWIKVPPVQRFIITRNPWMKPPHSIVERFEALEHLLADSLSDQDKRQAGHFMKDTEAELNRAVKESDPKLLAAQEHWRRQFDKVLYPTLKQEGPILMVDHAATKAALKEAKQTGTTEVTDQVSQEQTINALIEKRAHQVYIDLKRNSQFKEEDWIKTTIESHQEHQQKLALEVQDLNQESNNGNELSELEQAKLEDKIKKTKSNFIFLVSNMTVLGMAQRDETNFGESLTPNQAQQYREEIDQVLKQFPELELDEVKDGMRFDTLFNQSSASLVRQLEAAKQTALKAEQELQKLKEEGWINLRSAVKAGEATAIMGSLADVLMNEEHDELANQVLASGVTVRRNTVLAKFIPTDGPDDPLRKSFEMKHPDHTIISPREFIEKNWNLDEDFASFAKHTYFSDDPSSNYFWEKIRPLISEQYKIDMAELASAGQKVIIDKYLDGYLQTLGNSDSLAEFELTAKIDHELKTKLQEFVNEIVFAAYKGQKLEQLNPNQIVEYMKAYVASGSSFIEDPINEHYLNRYLAEHLLGIKDLEVVFLKCGRWISPGGRLSVVPTTDDYETLDKNGNPVLRSRHTERVNQVTLTQSLAPLLEMSPRPAEKTLVVADTDITRALGFTSDDEIKQSMDKYFAKLVTEIDPDVQVTTLSDIFAGDLQLQQLREQHYQVLAKIAMQGGPTEQAHEIYFTGGSHFERTVESVHLGHTSIPGWKRSPSGMEKLTQPLNPYRYIVEKHSDYIAWIQSMQQEAESNPKDKNVILVVGGRDPISTTMARASNGSVPIVKVSHYSDY